MNSQDPLKNGSIFKLKNLRAIRSPNHVIKSTNNSPGSVTKNVTFNHNDVKDNNTVDSTALIKQRFDQIYRATPLPSVLFNNTQFSVSNNHNQSHFIPHQEESTIHESISTSPQPQTSSSSSSSSSSNRDRINHQHNNIQKVTQQVYEQDDYNGNDNNDDNYINDDYDNNIDDFNHSDDTITKGSQNREKYDGKTNTNGNSNNGNSNNGNYNNGNNNNGNINNGNSNNGNNNGNNNNGTIVIAAPKRSSRYGLLASDSLQKIATPPVKRAGSVLSPANNSPQLNSGSKKVVVDSDVKKTTFNNNASDSKIKSKQAKVTKKKSKAKDKDFDCDDDSEYSGTEGMNKKTRSGRVSQPVNRLTNDELRSPNKDWKATSPSKRVPAELQNDKKWEPLELSILYRVHAVTNPTAPDFWSLVSAGIKEMGVHKSSEACQDQWYQSMLDARERRNKKNARDKNQGQNNDDETTTENNGQENVKKRKMNRAEIQQLAQKAVRAEKDDDIFDELNTRYSATETQNQLAQALESIRSPGGDVDSNKSNEKKDDNDITTNNKWKATYVHNLSKKVKNSVTVKGNNPVVSKVTSSIMPKSKKITEGKVSAALSGGKVMISIKNLDSDDELDEDEEDDEDEDD